MLEREFTYSMPFERSVKLGKRLGRKAFRASHVALWMLIATYAAALGALVYLSDDLNRLEQEWGMPAFLWFALAICLWLLGVYLNRRSGLSIMKARADYDSPVRFRQEATGLRIATPQIEYFVKWHGLSQILLEPDGVVLSHGGLFFVVPNEAFTDFGERDAFVRDVFGRRSDEAKDRSKAFVRVLIN